MLETLLRSDSNQCELGEQVTKLCFNREPYVNGIGRDAMSKNSSQHRTPQYYRWQYWVSRASCDALLESTRTRRRQRFARAGQELTNTGPYTLSAQAGCWHWQAISTSVDPASRQASPQYFS